MTVLDLHRPAPAQAPRGVVTNLIAAALNWADRRSTVHALGKLTDRELDDIGLSRGDLAQIARLPHRAF